MPSRKLNMNQFCLILLLVNLLIIPLSNAGEKNVYSFSWLDPDKEVYVLQNRKYRKKGKFHVSAGYGMTTSGAFIDANSFQARAGFFVYEEWGLEFLYAKNSGEENDTAASVRNAGTGLPGSDPFRRLAEDYLGGMLMWSPFYMKINTFNSILYVDWMIGIGYGKLTENNNRQEILTGLDDFIVETNTHSGILWGTAFKFFITDLFSVRTDLTGFVYNATNVDGTQEVTNTNYDFTIALGLNF